LGWIIDGSVIAFCLYIAWIAAGGGKKKPRTADTESDFLGAEGSADVSWVARRKS